MPVNIPVTLPAVEMLRNENIFVMDSDRASHQEIRPLKIVILNLMPIKITTETDLIRLLSNSPLQIELDLLQLDSHTSRNTPIEHMLNFYKKFDEIRKSNYDGMIITGAPVEQMPFEEVDYWPEMVKIMNWARNHVTSTLFICWASQAGMYHYYGVPKYPLNEKMFGVFEHHTHNPMNPIFRGFDDVFFVPHSRHTEIKREDIERVEGLTIIAESPESGVSMVMARNGREFFITGHLEYAPDTLDKEYKRDFGKRNDVSVPINYYRDDDPAKGPLVTWRSHANLLFSNWINYYVYQETPYNINDIT